MLRELKMSRRDADICDSDPAKGEEGTRETDKSDNSEPSSNIPAVAKKDNMSNITPLSSLEILTNNPTSYKMNVGPVVAEMEMARRESADGDCCSHSRSPAPRSCSRSPVSTNDSRASDSSCSPQFSPIPVTSSVADRPTPSSPSPVQAHMPYLYNNCDYKFLMHQRPGAAGTELLHYPVPTLETFSMPGSNGSRYLIAAPIPRKVPCVILPSTGDFNNNGHPNMSGPETDKCAIPLNYSTSRCSDSGETRKGISPQSSPVRIRSCSPRSPSPRSRDENSNSIDEVQMQDMEISMENAKLTTNTKPSKLTFGMDRILSNDSNNDCGNKNSSKIEKGNRAPSTCQDQDIYSSHDLLQRSAYTSNQFMRSLSNHQHQHQQVHALTASGGAACSPSPRNCPECILLAKFGYKLQFADGRSVPVPTPTLPTSTYAAGGYGPIITGSGLNSPWLQHNQSHPSSNLYDNAALISSNGFGHSNLPTSYGLGASNYASMSSMVSCNTNGGGRRKRSWSRAVFSNLQRKGLEKRFQMQKYITKPDRRQLAAMLGLTDAQVKVWFQNRRMKWRHTKEGKSGSTVAIDHSSLVHTNAAATAALAGIIPGKEKSKNPAPGHHASASMAFSSGKK